MREEYSDQREAFSVNGIGSLKDKPAIYMIEFANTWYVFRQFMHVLHVFARNDATSTFSCLEYVQIRAIRANTNKDTCIYVHQIQICRNTSGRIQ
jgi:hypothetical protein